MCENRDEDREIQTQAQTQPVSQSEEPRHPPAVAHHSHDGVLSGRQLLEVDQLDRLRLHHGLLRVHQVVHERVDPVPLVPRDGACRGERAAIVTS